MLVARDTLAADPGVNKRTLIKKAKDSVIKADVEKRLQHAKSLARQGQVFRCSEEHAATIWSIAVGRLPPELLKFSLNAVQDTLPHNSNLAMWRKTDSLSSVCKLCGVRQTLIHVLNNCPRALDLRRYNERHDAVLEVVSNFMLGNLPDDYQLLADLPQFQPYIFPPHIATTDERPDIVVWSDRTREVWVMELTICFETNYSKAHDRKTTRYSDLMDQIETTLYDGTLLTLEVGSRGFLSLPSFITIKQQLLVCEKKQWDAFLLDVVRTVITGSHKVWVTRNWTDSPFT